MSSHSIGGASSGFRIRRSSSLITSNGFLSDTDPVVAEVLAELNGLLKKPIYDKDAEAGGGGVKGLDPANVLEAGLTARRVKSPRWARTSLAYKLKQAGGGGITLAEYIDKTAELSELRYAFDELLAERWPSLTTNTKVVLDDAYPAIRDYIVAYAYLFKDIEEINGLKNFALAGPKGAARLIEYAAVSAGRELIKKKGLAVEDYDDDISQIVDDIRAALDEDRLSLSAVSYESDLLAIVDDNLFDGKYLKLLDKASTTLGPIPAELKPRLVEYIKASPVEVKDSNVAYFVSHWIAEINGSVPGPFERSTPEQSERDFDVEFIADDRSMIVVSKAAVKCAAQLYYSMVLGDELNVFGTVDFFTKRYLLRGGVEVTDHRLRDYLQEYVFHNRFTDVKTGDVLDRTRPSERQVFYRQVFNAAGPEISDSIANEDFPRHWKILMLESAEYLERAQESPNPDNYVSRQKVMQAVEDLQYNLSTHCTGMANVITPLVYAELNFVIRNIFMHPEVVKQVAPIGGTWWRVVERLQMEMKHSRPRATVFNNKARFGYEIIRAIADYNPATFERDAEFSAFISSVDAFITTQSILQSALEDSLKGDQEEQPVPNGQPAPSPAAVAAPPASNGSTPADDWDF